MWKHSFQQPQKYDRVFQQKQELGVQAMACKKMLAYLELITAI